MPSVGVILGLDPSIHRKEYFLMDTRVEPEYDRLAQYLF